MNNRCIGFLGGGGEQWELARWFARAAGWEVYPIFLAGPEADPALREVSDFRDVLWLCSVLVLPDPVCREGLILNAPLWPGGEVDAGQFLGFIGKGVLLLAGEMTPAFRRAAAAREVAVTRLPRGESPEERHRTLLEAVSRARGRAGEGPVLARSAP